MKTLFIVGMFFLHFSILGGSFLPEGEPIKGRLSKDFIDQQISLTSFPSLIDFIELVDILAPYDAELAKSYADQLKYETKVKAYIKIASHLDSTQAQMLLHEVKQQNLYSADSLKLIYEAEQKLCLPDAFVTLDHLRSLSVSSKAISRDLLTFIELTGNEGEQDEILAMIHFRELQKIMDSKDVSVFQGYTSLELLNVEAKLKNPLAFETIQALHRWAKNVRSSNQEDDSYAEQQYLKTWVNILSIEAKYPYLKDQFVSDCFNFFSLIDKYKIQFVEESDDLFECDLILNQLLKSIAPFHPLVAEKILSFVTTDDLFTEGMLALFTNKESHCLVDMERLFQEMETRLKKNNCEIDQVRMLLDSYQCKRLAHPLENVDLYLQKAKCIIRDFDDAKYDAEYKVEMLGDILKLELDYKLPSFKESLFMLRDCMREFDSVPSTVIIPYIRARILLHVD